MNPYTQLLIGNISQHSMEPLKKLGMIKSYELKNTDHGTEALIVDPRYQLHFVTIQDEFSIAAKNADKKDGLVAQIKRAQNYLGRDREVNSRMDESILYFMLYEILKEIWHTWDYSSVDELKESFVRNIGLNYKINEEMLLFVTENEPNIAIEEYAVLTERGVTL